MQRIIVATDGSPSAIRAVDAAARLAKVIGADLMVLTFGGNISGAELRPLARAEGDLSKALELAANRILDRARKRAFGRGMAAVKLQCGWGDPAQTIIDIVRREKADILVVGRRGRSPMSSFLLGSVSQKLTGLAACNLMAIP
jgi:nucleotide-binding universal stress UspA family protein